MEEIIDLTKAKIICSCSIHCKHPFGTDRDIILAKKGKIFYYCCNSLLGEIQDGDQFCDFEVESRKRLSKKTIRRMMQKYMKKFR